MINNFTRALSFTLDFEGGYSNDAADSGGETNFGITRKTYDTYRQSKGEFSQSVKMISDVEVSDIYYNEFWLKNHCDVLPDNIDIAVFDFSVNAGNEAMRELQKVAGVIVDGVFGAKTMAAVISANPQSLLNDYFTAHDTFYKGLVAKYPKNKRFLNGWLARTDKLQNLLT